MLNLYKRQLFRIPYLSASLEQVTTGWLAPYLGSKRAPKSETLPYSYMGGCSRR